MLLLTLQCIYRRLLNGRELHFGCRWFPNLQTHKSETDKCQLKYSISLQLMVLPGNLVEEQDAAVISCLLRASNSHYLKIVFVLF